MTNFQFSIFERILGTFEILSNGKLITKAVIVPNITIISDGILKILHHPKYLCVFILHFRSVFKGPIRHTCKKSALSETIAKAKTSTARPQPIGLPGIKLDFNFFFFRHLIF